LVHINIKKHSELITNYDLVAAAHGIMSGIELDVASSKIANEYVEAEAFFIHHLMMR